MFTHSDIHPIISVEAPEFLKDRNQESARSDFEAVLMHWKEICIQVFEHLEKKLEGRVQVTEFGGYAHGFTDGIDLKRGANKCCHPHYVLSCYAGKESQLQFIKSIYLTVGDNEQVNLQPVVEKVFSIFFCKRLICPTTMPKDSPEFITWLDTLSQCKPKNDPKYKDWLKKLRVWLPQRKPKNYPDFIAWLESLGARGIPFDERIKDLEAYKRDFSNCDVPEKKEGYESLRKWVGHIRQKRRERERRN